MTELKAKAEAEKIKEEYRNICVDIPEFDWEKRATRCAIIQWQAEFNLAERIFHDYGLGFMGAAISRNDFTKSALYKELMEIKKELDAL